MHRITRVRSVRADAAEVERGQEGRLTTRANGPTDGETPPATETPAPSDTPAPTEPSAPATPPAPGTPREQLDAALQAANQAMKDSEAALTAGDFAKYGEAQQRLNDALQKALEAEGALD